MYKEKDMIDRLFGSFEKKPIIGVPPSPTDKPDVKLFMLQILHNYGELTDRNGMRWTKIYRHKKNGKYYRVNVEILEESE